MEIDAKNMTTEELIDEVERGIYQEIVKHGFSDDSMGKRDKLLDQAKAIANIRSTYESNENSRLNNNARNEVEELKAMNEQEMIKIKRIENRINGSKVGVGALILACLYVLSYNMDSVNRQDNRLGKLIDSIANTIYFRK